MAALPPTAFVPGRAQSYIGFTIGPTARTTRRAAPAIQRDFAPGRRSREDRRDGGSVAVAVAVEV